MPAIAMSLISADVTSRISYSQECVQHPSAGHKQPSALLDWRLQRPANGFRRTLEPDMKTMEDLMLELDWMLVV